MISNAITDEQPGKGPPGDVHLLATLRPGYRLLRARPAARRPGRPYESLKASIGPQKFFDMLGDIHAALSIEFTEEGL